MASISQEDKSCKDRPIQRDYSKQQQLYFFLMHGFFFSFRIWIKDNNTQSINRGRGFIWPKKKKTPENCGFSFVHLDINRNVSRIKRILIASPLVALTGMAGPGVKPQHGTKGQLSGAEFGSQVCRRRCRFWQNAAWRHACVGTSPSGVTPEELLLGYERYRSLRSYGY